MPKQPKSVESQVEYPWILDELEGFPYELKRFFGCTAIYEGGRILFILHHRRTPAPDDGVWVATKFEHHRSLSTELADLSPVEVIGGDASDWRRIPEDSPRFESSVRRACELVRARDPRIGKVPGARKAAKSAGKQPGTPAPVASPSTPRPAARRATGTQQSRSNSPARPAPRRKK